MGISSDLDHRLEHFTIINISIKIFHSFVRSVSLLVNLNANYARKRLKSCKIFISLEEISHSFIGWTELVSTRQTQWKILFQVCLLMMFMIAIVWFMSRWVESKSNRALVLIILYDRPNGSIDSKYSYTHSIIHLFHWIIRSLSIINISRGYYSFTWNQRQRYCRHALCKVLDARIRQGSYYQGWMNIIS